MRYGFVGSFGGAAQVLALAEQTEAHGWDGFFTWDGISVGPMDTWDPWVLLGAAAARTERVTLGAMVFPLARRRPWKVAREALTVDHLSGGRLVVPVGLGVGDDGGFSRVRGEAATSRERAERLDEALAILDRAWTGEPFSWDGRHYAVTDLQIGPPPVQRPRVPIWVVGAWPAERSMERAARWDGVVLQRARSMVPLTPADVAEAVAWLTGRRALLRAEGYPLGAAYDVVVSDASPDHPAAAAAHVEAFREAGATWWVEARWDPEKATPHALLDRIRQGPPVG
ncbi:MAG TPA: LLM class flavin-dependent oxidoreductase [Actinotalea sp.]|nr:LLM class flavin-dependent oxidoreductase [Actinotalea sp.]